MTKPLLPLDRLIHFHLRLGELSTHIWFSVALNLAVDTLLGTSFTYRFIRGIFPSERKVALWHSQPVTIIAHLRTPKDTCIPNNIRHSTAQAGDQNVYHDARYDVVRVAQQIVLQPNITCHVLVRAKPHHLHTIEPKALPTSRLHTLAARQVVNISPNQPFQIFVSSFSGWEVGLLKRMIIALWGTTPDIIRGTNFNNQKKSWIGPPE